jgi:hypothetical protein
VLGLTIFRYDMVGVSRYPIEWMDASEDDAGGMSGGEGEGVCASDGGRIGIGSSSSFGGGGGADADRTTVDDQDTLTTEELEAFLRRRREREMEELNAGLRIHHDERLDEFAGARWSSSSSSSHRKNDSIASGGTVAGEDWEGREYANEEGGWDFDETEDPVALMEESYRTKTKTRVKGNLSDGGEKKAEDKGGALPIWKNP